jgi:NADPH-dependent ferric siderophore reductase
MPDTEATPAERPGRYRGMRILRVLRTAAITPRMRRITLGGEEICTAMRAPPRGGRRAHSRETFLESEDPEGERSAMPTGTCWRAITRRCRRSARSSKSFLPQPAAKP